MLAIFKWFCYGGGYTWLSDEYILLGVIEKEKFEEFMLPFLDKEEDEGFIQYCYKNIEIGVPIDENYQMFGI
jgi:hypothetical protein